MIRALMTVVILVTMMIVAVGVLMITAEEAGTTIVVAVVATVIMTEDTAVVAAIMIVAIAVTVAAATTIGDTKGSCFKLDRPPYCVTSCFRFAHMYFLSNLCMPMNTNVAYKFDPPSVQLVSAELAKVL